MFLIYLLINKTNDKVYIGQTSRTLEQRWQEHIYCAKENLNKHLYHAMRKDGFESFSKETLNIVQTKEEADKFERFWIITLDSNKRNCGYNLTLGGEGSVGWNPSEETRKKMSLSATGRRLSEEAKAKVSAAGKGVKKPPRSPEHAAKIGAANKGKPKTEYWLAIMRNRVQTEEHRLKNSLAQKRIWAERKRLKEENATFAE